jgi:hypothetical protein
MKKLEVHNPNVTCGSCRKFDGHTWCKHWNFFTTAESPPCRFYSAKPKGQIRDSSEVFPEESDGGL